MPSFICFCRLCQRQNAVGYITPDAIGGDKVFVGVPFEKLGGGSIDIQEIKALNGTSDRPGNSTFRMWWYDPDYGGYRYAQYTTDAYADDGTSKGDGTEINDGVPSASKVYYWVEEKGYFVRVPEGWNDYGDGTISTINDWSKTFVPGEGFFVNPNGALQDPKITVSGQVVSPDTTKEYVTIDVTGGDKTAVINPFLYDFDIQDIKAFNGESDRPGNSTFRMWWYDPDYGGYRYAQYTTDAYADDGTSKGDGTEINDGVPSASKVYYWVEEKGYFVRVPAGWNDYGDGTISTINDWSKTFEGTEGFFVNPNGALKDPKVGFKNPLYKAD